MARSSTHLELSGNRSSSLHRHRAPVVRESLHADAQPSDIDAREADGAVVGKRYATSTTAVDNFTMDLGIFAQHTLAKIS